jgi:hypothetical protein
LGFAPAERQRFIEKSELPYFDGTQDYCLWLGCMGAYDPQGREIVLALARLLRHAGVTFGVPRKEKCTGDAARRLGNDLAAAQLAESNIETLRAAKVGRMVSICPHCVRTIGTDWREYGVAFDIVHHSELLARLGARLPAAQAPPGKVVFHDPCYLGRYRDIYDEPRRVLRRYTDVIEPPRARERSFCCGAGGGQMFLGEEKGTRVNLTRAEELMATGAAVIDTACFATPSARSPRPRPNCSTSRRSPPPPCRKPSRIKNDRETDRHQSGSTPGAATRGSGHEESVRAHPPKMKSAPLRPSAGKERIRFSLEIRVKRRRAVQRRDQAAVRVSNQPAWGPAI